MAKEVSHTGSMAHMRNFKHGRDSKVMKDFLAKHGLSDLNFPSTGSFSKDMMLSVVALKEKQEALHAALQVLGSRDARALTLYNQLVGLHMRIADFERKCENDSVLLMNNPMYLKWQQMVLDILKHFDKMRFDIHKIKAEQRVKVITKGEEDTLYIVEDEDVRPSKPD